MTPEAEKAPMDHIKVSHAQKQELVIRLFHKNAFSRETALSENEFINDAQEKLALERLISEGEVVFFSEEKSNFYYLIDQYKPPKNYRKQVVIGLSIPLLIFIVTIIVAGIGTILYQILFGF